MDSSSSLGLDWDYKVDHANGQKNDKKIVIDTKFGVIKMTVEFLYHIIYHQTKRSSMEKWNRRFLLVGFQFPASISSSPLTTTLHVNDELRIRHSICIPLPSYINKHLCPWQITPSTSRGEHIIHFGLEVVLLVHPLSVELLRMDDFGDLLNSDKAEWGMKLLWMQIKN